MKKFDHPVFFLHFTQRGMLTDRKTKHIKIFMTWFSQLSFLNYFIKKTIALKK